MDKLKGVFKKSKEFIKKNKKKTIVILVLLLTIGSIKLTLDRGKDKTGAMSIETMILEKKSIENTISTAGTVVSDNKTNIYSLINAPVKEIRVAVGDQVKKGDVLAVLDISGLENELDQAKLNLRSSLEAISESSKDSKNSVENAKISLESSEISLRHQEAQTKKAEEDLNKMKEKAAIPFDFTSYNFNVNEALTSLNNKERNLKLLKDEGMKLRADVNKFDENSYLSDIKDKQTLIDRKKDELSKLSREISDSRYDNKRFDDFTYKNAIEDCQRDLDRLNQELAATTDELEIKKIKDNIAGASVSLDRAKENLTRAREDFDRASRDSQNSSKRALEKAYDQLKYEIDDLERESQKIGKNKDSAKSDFAKKVDQDLIKNESDVKAQEYEVLTAKNNYEKALKEKETAMKDYVKKNIGEIELAEKNVDTSKSQLETANNNFKNAKTSLNQANKKTVSSVNKELNKLTIEKLEEQILKGNVVATEDGVITEIKAEIGSVPSGQMFSIEDLENVHIKGNIKEHNLGSIYIGQKANLTTLASGNEKFQGSINFISPRAVSPVGAPAVEFEIRVKPNRISEKIKPGMNAFLNIILDSKENVFVVPIGAIKEEDGKKYLYTDKGEPIEVITGIQNKTELEVISDRLEEGMLIQSSFEMEGMVDQPQIGVVM